MHDPMLPRPFLVAEIGQETPDTVSMMLVPADAGPVVFWPGQFSMLYVFGIGEVPISISGDPENNGALHFTIRAVGAVTGALTEMEVGQTIGVRGPYGSGWPLHAEEERDLVIVAGGIGLAPLRPAVHYALSHRDDFRAVSLVYGARTPGDMLYPDELHEWRSRFDLDVEITVDRAEDYWRGNVGVVTQLLTRIGFEPERTTALVCGPEVMMRATARALLAAGVGAEDIAVSLERNMKCAIGFCGHCQLGPEFLCKDGPVLSYGRMAQSLLVVEL